MSAWQFRLIPFFGVALAVSAVILTPVAVLGSPSYAQSWTQNGAAEFRRDADAAVTSNTALHRPDQAD